MGDEEPSKDIPTAVSPAPSTSTPVPTLQIRDNGGAGSSSSGLGTSSSVGEDDGPRVRFSDKTKAILEESELLLKEQPTASVLLGLGLPSSARATTSRYGLDRDETEDQPSSSSYISTLRNPLEPSPSLSYLSTHRYAMNRPTFNRVDFDDVVDDAIRDRKPSWQQMQDSVKDSYARPKRTVDRNKDINEFMDLNVLNRRRLRRSQSPFGNLDGESLSLRKPSWFANGAMEPRGLRKTASSAYVQPGPYAAPALSKTSGIESRSRYDQMVDDIEVRLLKTTLLPEYMKTVTKREFRRAPEPSSGSAAEGIVNEDELAEYAPKPYYSRPNRRDPDYFDSDLEHSVNMYRRPEGRYYPRGPQDYEHKIMHELGGKGEAPISAHMFNNTVGDWRNTGTSYLSAALRTPSFWEHRFKNIGSQVRDSNPISLDSLNRNRPQPNRFTEYKDPDLEGLSDLDDD
ncbi:unnamed protein product [Bursaphelenchus xylophilus]|uniref:(pine wood nematode) hypothetical protein n=1 Tax=Bursaphelenchus xylophilus TaxID=6326 RepID=A0A1I7S004_BURXY|nr:unnamed protein product [Bursaphelenchus xylophilus]CAG9109110.1 unnamed protein product [Bursaphelenchus xylophilus]